MPEADEAIRELARRKLNIMQRGTSRGTLKRIPKILQQGEHPITLAQGREDGLPRIVVLTDRRLIFMQSIASQHGQQDYALSQITSIENGAKILEGWLAVYAAGSFVELGGIAPKESAQEIADYVRAHATSPEPAAPAAPPEVASGADAYEQLRKLGELRDSGVLTSAEFESKKVELLSRL